MRSCGILMHISSLPSPYGIGTFGAEAEKFADWLKEAGQKYWQVLPIGPTGYGDSPYQPFSSFAGNPLLIDLDELVEHGYLAKKSLDNSDYGADPSYVDFDIVNRNKTALLREAFAGFTDDVGYTSFVIEEQDWLDDYALFMALKDKFGGRPWSDWDDDIKLRKKGSAGGHNGIKHIIQQLGTQNFVRIKVGVGAKPKGWDLADYVLGRFDKEDRALIEEAQERACKAVELILTDSVDAAMNEYNKKTGNV